MCGIFGYIGDTRLVSRSKINACLDSIAHRGPDGHGIKYLDNAILGHRRLSIIDLSSKAHQPMTYSNKRYWITFNGEIYNYLELKESLIKKGYEFISNSDTEVILASFEHWGYECLKRFNGMWSFAIWDNLNNELFLSRDRYGKKPLYYTFFKNRNFVFCSEMKGLYKFHDSITVNKNIVSNYDNYFSYESTSNCVITELQRFPSGSYGIYKNNKLIISKWWRTEDNLIEVPNKYNDQVEMFHDLFIDSCKLRMRSDVPIGTSLSGGLDSSSVFSCMATLGRQIYNTNSWQHAFIASFPGCDIDEKDYAIEIANKYSVHPSVIEINPNKYLDKIYDYYYLLEDPYITCPFPFIQLYEQIKKEGVSVTLDGHGADEIFGGYAFDIIKLLYTASFYGPDFDEIISTFYNLHRDTLQLRPERSRLFLSNKWRIKKILKKMHDLISTKKTHFSSDSLNNILYESFHDTVLPTLLRNYDRYSMLNGVEVRMPFMDHRIVSFGFSIPWRSKIKNGNSKSIIRDAMKPYVSRKIIERKEKIGFNSPLVEWMQGAMKEFLLDTTSDISFNNSTLINSKKVKKNILNALYDKKLNFQKATRVWSSITPYLWEKSLRINEKNIQIR